MYKHLLDHDKRQLMFLGFYWFMVPGDLFDQTAQYFYSQSFTTTGIMINHDSDYRLVARARDLM